MLVLRAGEHVRKDHAAKQHCQRFREQDSLNIYFAVCEHLAIVSIFGKKKHTKKNCSSERGLIWTSG